MFSKNKPFIEKRTQKKTFLADELNMGSKREADRWLWTGWSSASGLTKAESQFGRAFKSLHSTERLKAKAALVPCLFLISTLPTKQSHTVTAHPPQVKPWRGLATVSLYSLEAWSSLRCWPKVHTTLHWLLRWLKNTIYTPLCSLRLCTLLLQRPTHPGYPRATPELKLHVSSSSGETHKHILHIADGGTKSKEHSFPCMTISLAQINASSLCDPQSLRSKVRARKRTWEKLKVSMGTMHR